MKEQIKNRKDKDMKISEINIIPIKPREGVLAFCSFILNDSFYIGNVAIYKHLNREGFRLSYPSRTLPNALSVSCFHPINQTVGREIESAVSETYEGIIEKATGEFHDF